MTVSRQVDSKGPAVAQKGARLHGCGAHENPATTRAGATQLEPPVPSAPLLLSPHDQSEPSASRASAQNCPAAMAVAAAMPITGFGSRCSRLVLLPSWLHWPHPQAHTVPSAVRANACLELIATSRTWVSLFDLHRQPLDSEVASPPGPDRPVVANR